MNVSLTPELERLVSEKVASGLYTSASEVVREGLRLLQERDRRLALELDALRRDLEVGEGQLDRGEGTPGPKVMARLRRKYARRRAG